MNRKGVKKSYADLAEINRKATTDSNSYWLKMPGGGELYGGALRDLRQSRRPLNTSRGRVAAMRGLLRSQRAVDAKRFHRRG